jgi:DNA transformation protein and related proteins
MDPETIRDLFAGLGPVRTRKMFGGQSVYSGDLMFALEAYGEL